MKQQKRRYPEVLVIYKKTVLQEIPNFLLLLFFFTDIFFLF